MNHGFINMRLWHWQLIPYLPKSQLVAQWRELNSIFKKQDKHILINYVYEYPKNCLFGYSSKVITEMKKRGYKIKNWDNWDNYFKDIKKDHTCDDYVHINPFKNHHNKQYLEICYFNLEEKYIRGQKDFDDETWNKLNDFVKKECGV